LAERFILTAWYERRKPIIRKRVNRIARAMKTGEASRREASAAAILFVFSVM
jgi:hypothetical protein